MRGRHANVNATTSAAAASAMIHTSGAIVTWSARRHRNSDTVRLSAPNIRNTITDCRASGWVPRTCRQWDSIDKASQANPMILLMIAASSIEESGPRRLRRDVFAIRFLAVDRFGERLASTPPQMQSSRHCYSRRRQENEIQAGDGPVASANGP